MDRMKKHRILLLAAVSIFVTLPHTARVSAASTPVRHVVVLYMENHSFDNVLGFWCAQTRHCDGMPASVTLKGGIKVVPTTAPDLIPTMEHSVAGQIEAVDGGAMDGWAALNGCSASANYACVSGYQPAQIPNEITLATHFAISDRTFSMDDSASWAGHLYAVAASTDGFSGDNPSPAETGGPGWGCDADKLAGWVSSTGTKQQEPSCVPDPGLGIANGGAFQPTPVKYIPTIMDRLDAASLTWRIYTDPTASGHGAYNWATCPSFAECLDTRQRANMVNTSQVISDADAGTLPAFSLVLDGVTPGYTSIVQHNGMSMARGDNFIGTLATALQRGPEWGSTTLFITYDDCGCFYDHVAPRKNRDGTSQGPRSPLVIVSPYAIPGFVDTTPTTFEGILAYTEQTFGLAPLSADDAAAYAFGKAFDYTRPARRAVPMRRTPLPAASAAAAAPVSDDAT